MTMNDEARRHVEKAAEYIARGEKAYRQAAAEMTAAKESGATWDEIARGLGRSKSWCKKVVDWAEDGSAPSPFAEPERDTPDVRGTRRILEEAPMEQVERIVSQLPPERQKALAAAAGHAYLGARQEADERAPVEGRVIVAQPVRRAVGAFTALDIVQHLEQATEHLRELQADASLTPDAARSIGKALDVFTREFEFAKELIGEAS